MKPSKKVFWKLYGLEIIFMSVMLFLFILIKNKIKSFLTELQAAAPLLPTAPTGTEVTPEQMALIMHLESSTGGMMFLLFVCVPIIVMFAWGIKQELFTLIARNEKKTKKELFKTSILHAMLAFVYLLVVYHITGFFSQSYIEGLVLSLFGITLIFSYLHSNMLIAKGKKLGERMSEGMMCCFKNTKRDFFMQIMLFISGMVLFFFFMMLYTSSFTKFFFFLPPVSLIGTVLVITAIHVFLKQRYIQRA